MNEHTANSPFFLFRRNASLLSSTILFRLTHEAGDVELSKECHYQGLVRPPLRSAISWVGRGSPVRITGRRSQRRLGSNCAIGRGRTGTHANSVGVRAAVSALALINREDECSLQGSVLFKGGTVKSHLSLPVVDFCFPDASGLYL